jgi:hypothetical protein
MQGQQAIGLQLGTLKGFVVAEHPMRHQGTKGLQDTHSLDIRLVGFSCDGCGVGHDVPPFIVSSLLPE